MFDHSDIPPVTMPVTYTKPGSTKSLSVRMKRRESAHLSEHKCREVKAKFYRVFQTVHQFEESMAQSLPRGQRIEVSNLVLPALNVLTGIQGYCNGYSMMPTRPVTMAHDLYDWARKMYDVWVPLRILWRDYPDLSGEGFFEWQRRKGQQNAGFERFCGVED